MSWPAKYPGTCGACGHRFEVGVEVKWGEGATLVEVLCWPREEDMPDLKAYRAQMCTSCWTVHGAGQVGCG